MEVTSTLSRVSLGRDGLGSVGVRSRFRTRGVCVGDADEFDVRQFVVDPCVVASHGADADDASPQYISVSHVSTRRVQLRRRSGRGR